MSSSFKAGVAAAGRAALQGFVLFFDRFCIELEDRRQFPFKSFSIIGSKCAGDPTAASACMSNAVLLYEAIETRLTLEPHATAALTAMYRSILDRLSPNIRLQRLYEHFDKPECKFLKCAVYALEALTGQETGALPIRLQRLMTNSMGGPKLDTAAFLETGHQLLREFGCKSRAAVELNAEAGALLKSVMASVVPRAPPVPSGPIVMKRRHRTASSSERTRATHRTRLPARVHRTGSSSEQTRRRFRRKP